MVKNYGAFLIYRYEGAQRVFRPKNKHIYMALIKIKQVDGLQTEVNKIVEVAEINSKDTSILALATAADAAQSVDSKDTSILGLATASVTDLSVDSKDASILSLADSNAENYVIDASVDSKDTSILALATAADTAQSVDSKDASILVAANAYADAIEADLHNYSEEVATFNAPNDFGINGNFDLAGGDYEVYVNGLHVKQTDYTLAPGGNIVFTGLSYTVDSADEVVIMGHIA